MTSVPVFVISVHASMKSALGSLTAEKSRLRQMLDQEACPAPPAQLLGLKSALAAVRPTT